MGNSVGALHYLITKYGVPDGWEQVKVGDLAQLVGGGTPDREERSYWTDATIPWATPTDLTEQGAKWIHDTAEKITEKALSSCSANLLPVGSVLYTSRATIGTKTIAAVPITTNQGFANFIPDGRVNDQFLYYFLDLLTPVFTRLAAGTTFLEVSKRELRKVNCAVPPKSEAAIIAAILDAADTAIERTRVAIAKSRRVKLALSQALFIRGIGHARFAQTVLGNVPDSWKVVPVGETLTEAQYGLSMPMQTKGAYPILRMAAIQDGDVLLNDLKYVDLPKYVAEQYLVQRGDVLFNRTNSADLVGKVGIYRHDRPSVFASYLIRLKVNPSIADSYFLGQLLSSYAAQCRIKRYATPGVQQVNINATNIKRVLIALPAGPKGLEEQRQIAEVLERQNDSIREQKNRVMLLQRLKRGLLQVLLTGKVRVKVSP